MANITREPPANRNEILAALDAVRKKLLDLTAHNPLLSFNHGRSTRYLRVVDELPNQVVTLLLEEKRMRFAPVAKPDPQQIRGWKQETGNSRDPSPKEWAEKVGILTSDELPSESRRGASRRHSDKYLQTLHFPDQLEARLVNMARLARTTIEETGVNMLHLIVGFLEWYEDESSDKPRLAPLITIPVNLEKGKLSPSTRTYEYELSYSGEDCQENVSLSVRLEQDFGYKIPELPNDFEVETYLKKIERSVKRKFPRWAVRRYMTVGFLNFGKLLMYRDLDPRRWPKGGKLEDNPLVGSVIGGTHNHDEGRDGGLEPVFQEEYPIDEMKNIYDQYPLVDNADSSQHSALIDAINGKNLVIEGPPGTGKSQTITNLIAAAMNAGRSVLFVSEKLAALEVVKQRLDNLGLGEFCLELHSHATQKAGVIESLKKRIERPRPSFPAAYDDEKRRHQKLVKKLSKHAKRVNAEWKNTGLSIHEIFVGMARLREELPDELRNVVEDNVETTDWTDETMGGIVEQAKAFQRLVHSLISELNGCPPGESHPWKGIGTTELPTRKHSQVVGHLENWTSKLREIETAWGKL